MIPLHVTAWEFFLVAVWWILKWGTIGVASVYGIEYFLKAFHAVRAWAHGDFNHLGWYHRKHPRRGFVFDASAWTLFALAILFAVCLCVAAIEHDVAPDKYKATPEAVQR